jgi:hypothetical protein
MLILTANPANQFKSFPVSYPHKQKGDSKMKLKILSFITILLLTFSAQADNDAPSPSCSKPDKPIKFISQSELDGFNNDVQQYQRCLYDFVDVQEDAIQRHQRAAKVAIDEWNSFVKKELN